MYQLKGSEQSDDAEQESLPTMDQALKLLNRKGPLQFATPRQQSAPVAPEVAIKSEPQLSE